MESARDLQISLIIRESSKALALGVASAWLIAAAMYDGNRQLGFALRAISWAALLSAVLVRGIWLGKTFRSQGADSDSLHRSSRRLQRNGLLAAILWGLSSSILLDGNDREHETILVLGIALITMGAATGRAAHVPIIAVLVLTTSATFSAGLLLRPGSFHLYIGLGYLLFGIVIALFVRAQANTVKRERELNIEIEDLLSKTQIQEQRAQALRVQAETAREEAVVASAEADAARLQAERASAAKTRFLATASHDLRQPMHSIGLIVGVLRTHVKDGELVTLTERIQASVSTMETLFGSLLDISKLDAGAVRPRVETTDLGHLFLRLEQTWTPLAAERALSLRVRPTRLLVRTDAGLLERIVGNLIANAIQYSHQGGILVAGRRRGDMCAIQIWDTGQGIPAEHSLSIFDEFFRIDGPSYGTKGLGLGLSIVQRSADLLGHGLNMQSRMNRGSMFELVVPCLGFVNQPIVFDGTPPICADAMENRFVVVVDDNAHNLEALVNVLVSWRCHVVSAASGTELFESLRTHLRVPDLIISDHRLGAGRTGLEEIAMLRDHYELPIPALILTADTDSDLASRATLIGALVLHKPAGVGQLIRAATDLLMHSGIADETAS